MPQKPRTIHPTDAQDERLAGLPLSAAYTYAYLPTVLDDDGRTKDQPAVLNGYLWPLRADDHPTAAMAADLDALVAAGLLCRYTVEDQTYLHDPEWRSRQRMGRPVSSRVPRCPTHDKSFDDAMSEAMGRFSQQFGPLFGEGGFDEAKIRDSVARVVEDVTFLVDPEKAASFGEKVRAFMTKSGRSWPGPQGPSGTARSSGPQPSTPGPQPSPDGAEGAQARPAPEDEASPHGDPWRDATDQPPSS